MPAALLAHRLSVGPVADRAAELANLLDPDNPPLVETIVGGKGPWEKTRELLLDRLLAFTDARRTGTRRFLDVMRDALA